MFRYISFTKLKHLIFLNGERIHQGQKSLFIFLLNTVSAENELKGHFRKTNGHIRKKNIFRVK
jgi:hypothetical protein